MEYTVSTLDATLTPAARKDDLNATTLQSLSSFFGNHLLLKRLIRHLDHASIKCLIEVSVTLKELIRNEPGFLARSRIRIQVPPTTSDELDREVVVYKTSDFPWKTVKIEIGKCREPECLKLMKLLPKVDILDIDTTQKSKDELLFKGLLNAAKNIKDITLGVKLLESVSPTYLQSKIGELENLKNVEGVHILDRYDWLQKFRAINQEYYNTVEILLGIPVALTSFSLKGSVIYSSDRIEKIMVTLFQKYKITLRKLDLEHVVWKNESMQTTFLSNLKELSIVADAEWLPQVSTFIANQPPLKILELQFLNPVKCLQPLMDALRKHSPHVTKFTLDWMSKISAEPDDSEEHKNETKNPPFDFSFLRRFLSLTEVKIRQLREIRTEILATPGLILSSIPDTISTIEIVGGLPGDDPNSTIESLGRFQHLMVLDLLQCGGPLNDESFQFICINMTQLREFGFSHCHELSDVGITGKRNGVTIHPGLLALTGLKRLKIIRCNRITPEAYLAALSFRDLMDLILMIEYAVTEEFYLHVVAQNKNLVRLQLFDTRVEDMRLGTYNSKTPLELLSLEKRIKETSKRFREVSVTLLDLTYMPEPIDSTYHYPYTDSSSEYMTDSDSADMRDDSDDSDDDVPAEDDNDDTAKSGADDGGGGQ